MYTRPIIAVGTVAVVAIIAVVVTFAFLGDLPWQGPSDDVTPTAAAATATMATTAVTGNGTASPGTRTTEPTGPPKASFVQAFPKLPKVPQPTNMIEVPGQNLMLLTAQDGRVLSFANDPEASELTMVLDWREKTSREGFEEGLLGLALDPQFAQNGYVYVYYSAKPGERRTVLSRFETSGSGASLRMEPESELIILTLPQPYSNHNGGQLAFGPDGMLYLGLGDGGSGGDPNGNGQDITRNLLGSIIRIDVRGATPDKPYAIPPDNPFVGSPNGAKPETWAYGLRNPWRFSFDADTGVLWAGDVGQDKYEEADLIERGHNYGWNIMEGFHCYKPMSGCDEQGLTLPVAEYTHDDGCSITGGYVYRGKEAPSAVGYYVFGDYCSGRVWAVPAGAAKPGTKLELIDLTTVAFQLPSFAVDAEGELYALGFDGDIWKMVGD